MKSKRQRGYTAVELATAIAIGLLISSVSVVSVMGRLKGQRLASATETARLIAITADLNRKSVESSTLNPTTNVYSYTYRDVTAWTTVANFNTTYGTTLPAQTVWGTDYEIRASGNNVARVRFIVPLNYRAWPVNSMIEALSATSYRVNIWAEQRAQPTNMRIRRFRQDLLNETPRR